jgi:hypothetical protein
VRQAAYVVSMVALAATVAPPLLLLAGRLSLDGVKLAMNVAALAWFVATPLWMGRAPRAEGPDPPTAGVADRAL